MRGLAGLLGLGCLTLTSNSASGFRNLSKGEGSYGAGSRKMFRRCVGVSI